MLTDNNVFLYFMCVSRLFGMDYLILHHSPVVSYDRERKILSANFRSKIFGPRQKCRNPCPTQLIVQLRAGLRRY